MKRLLLEFCNVESEGHGTQNIKDVSFQLFEGEFVAIVGADNSGKSRIINLLGGESFHMRGDIFLSGSRYAPHSLAEANRLGVYCVREESSLQDNQSLQENFFVNNGTRALISLVHQRTDEQRMRELLEYFSLDYHPSTTPGILSSNEKAILEIVKYAQYGAKLIVIYNAIKNPSLQEQTMFLRVLERIVAKGTGVLLITNQCLELLHCASRLLIMSIGGRLAHTMYAEDICFDKLKAYLVHSVEETVPERPALNCGAEFMQIELLPERIKFSLREGEIVGLLQPPCVSGNGIIQRILHANIHVNGKRLYIDNETDALQQGVGVIPDNPRRLYFPDLSLEENVAMPFLERASSWGVILQKRKLRVLNDDIRGWKDILQKRFGYRQMDESVYSIIIRFLMYPYRFILLTQMHDMNDMRKAEMLYWMIDMLARQGKTILVASSSTEKLKAICTRIIDLPTDES